MTDVLVAVDLQNDFIDGSLGSQDAQRIVEKAKEKIQAFQGIVLFTRDTHREDYLDTEEGKNLPVKHCIEGTKGWEIREELDRLRTTEPIDKPTFGSVELGRRLKEIDEKDGVRNVVLLGLCTDICVISNAMIAKAFLPEVSVSVDASCCAGVTPESHKNALAAMKACQITVEHEI